MRKSVVWSLLAATTLTLSSHASAAGPTRSVDDYLCTFAGQCGAQQQQQGDQDSVKAPDRKGFALPMDSEPAGGASQSSASPAKGPAPKKQVRKVAARKAAPAAERRADLRVSFENASFELTDSAKEEMKVFATFLLRPEVAGKRFQIEGHTNAVGSQAYNLNLSQQRAEAVADYLVSLGVPRDRFVVKGFGFAHPLPGKVARAPENRRVEAVLLS
jgi:outer membrane protein OmpA-like peptidoglycan-associated protein